MYTWSLYIIIILASCYVVAKVQSLLVGLMSIVFYLLLYNS